MKSLREYIEKQMSMSHIYQPVMIRTLLESSGIANKELIARNISTRILPIHSGQNGGTSFEKE